MKNLFNFLNKASRIATDLNKQASNINNFPKTLGLCKEIAINQIPSTTDKFIQLRDTIAKTPEGGAVLLILAAIKYTEAPQVGRHWMIIATYKDWLTKSDGVQAYKGFDLGNSANFSLKQLDGKNHIAYSYVKGTSIANSYQPGNLPYNFSIERSTDANNGVVKVYMVTAGADAARPITMKKNEVGIWKAFEYSSIFIDVKAPLAKSQGAADGDF